MTESSRRRIMFESSSESASNLRRGWRRRPNGRRNAKPRGVHASRTAEDSGSVGRLHRDRRHRAALAEPGPDRPQITHGVQSGDVSVDLGVVWARADRPSRMLVEVATTDSFRDIQSAVLVDALPESDFTAKALIEDLPPSQDIFYRISFQDLSSAVFGEPSIGRFRTAPQDRRSISFLWSGDTMGQGWGIDKARGGMRTYATMRRNRPDFFIHCGDNIYADCPINAEQKLPDGEVWRSIVTEEKSKPAETLADYRGNYKYNLLDENLRAFNAEVPTFALWDNHEVMEIVVAGRAAAAAARRRAECAGICGARPPGVPRIPADARDHGGAGPHLSQNFSMARCSTYSCSTCAAIAGRMANISTASMDPTIICSARSRSLGSSVSCCARRRPGR